MTKTIFRLLMIFLLSLAVTAGLAGPASAHRPTLNRIELPAGFQPEGITIGRGPTAYLGSLANGDIYAVNLRTGAGRIISDGPGTPSVGLKVDGRGRLFVAGGPAGEGRVVDIGTGKFVPYHFTDAPSFVNDVVLTRSMAWFTDSSQAQLYGLPLGRNGKLPDQSDVVIVTLPLRGDWDQVPEAFNANGIVQTPDHKALIVVQSNTGLLFRVDPDTGVATKIDLGSTVSLPNGDGLLLEGRTLYVVQNQLNQVAVVQLNRAGTAGVLVDTLTSPDFDVPTTVASFGHSLYLPNARFRPAGTPPPEEYWITRIDKHRGR
jgi:sugar lactone lactonase YvrE